MKDFRRGIKFYTYGKCEITMEFPENDICCQHCRMSYKDGMGRIMCTLLSHEIYRPKVGIMQECPLTFEIESEQTNRENLDDLI